MPVVLFGRAYWQRILGLAALSEFGPVSRDDLTLLDIVDDAEGGFAAVLRRGSRAHTPREDLPPEPA